MATGGILPPSSRLKLIKNLERSMSNDHKLLWQQVGSLAKDDRMVARAKDCLSDLFNYAGRGRFDLGPDLFSNQQDLADALGAALKRKDVSVVTVSIDDDEQPDSDTFSPDEICRLNQGFKLGPSLWEALWARYNWAWQEGFRQGPGEDARKRLERVLLLTVGRKLEAAVWKTLEDSPRWRRHRASISNGIWDCVRYYLGFIILGDKQRAGRLENLIKTLPRALFFCARDEEMLDWLVLTG